MIREGGRHDTSREPGDLPSSEVLFSNAAGGAAGARDPMTTATLQTQAATTRSAEGARALLVAAFLGLGLVFVAGFAPASVLHNAAHDFRHAQNFPCH